VLAEHTTSTTFYAYALKEIHEFKVSSKSGNEPFTILKVVVGKFIFKAIDPSLHISRSCWHTNNIGTVIKQMYAHTHYTNKFY